ALAAAGALAYTQLTAKPDVTVPSAVGQDQDAATAALRTAGFDVETVTRPSAIPGGIVLAQRPRDGKRIPEGDTVRIFVSDVKAEMPDLFGINEIDAATSLRNLGLVNIAYVDRFTDAADPGSVVASDPLAHQFALKSGTVTLTIARDTTVRVPEVRTFSEADARAKLEFAGYVVAVARASSRTVPVGSVISVSPAVSSIGTRGDTATLKVSTGPPLVSVPNVVGEDADDARDDLEGRGLVVNEVTVAITSGSSGKVISQDPTGGQLAEGSTVTINVGRRTR
ncbi:MAG: PASTA domain-containing protein, partial [Acidimicrobiia bacterium]